MKEEKKKQKNAQFVEEVYFEILALLLPVSCKNLHKLKNDIFSSEEMKSDKSSFLLTDQGKMNSENVKNITSMCVDFVSQIETLIRQLPFEGILKIIFSMVENILREDENQWLAFQFHGKECIFSNELKNIEEIIRSSEPTFCFAHFDHQKLSVLLRQLGKVISEMMSNRLKTFQKLLCSTTWPSKHSISITEKFFNSRHVIPRKSRQFDRTDFAGMSNERGDDDDDDDDEGGGNGFREMSLEKKKHSLRKTPPIFKVEEKTNGSGKITYSPDLQFPPIRPGSSLWIPKNYESIPSEHLRPDVFPVPNPEQHVIHSFLRFYLHFHQIS